MESRYSLLNVSTSLHSNRLYVATSLLRLRGAIRVLSNRTHDVHPYRKNALHLGNLCAQGSRDVKARLDARQMMLDAGDFRDNNSHVLAILDGLYDNAHVLLTILDGLYGNVSISYYYQSHPFDRIVGLAT